MKPKCILVLILFFIITSTHAQQLTEKIKRQYVVPGVVILGGKEVVGYLKIMGKTSLLDEQFNAPWEFQSTIRFMEKNLFEAREKFRYKDFVKYDAKDIDGYRYNNDSLVFISVKYSDLSAVGTGMIPKTKFMRVLSEGKITTFYHFQTPPPVGGVSNLKEIYIEDQEPELVYRIGPEGKLKLVNSLNVQKELSDCPVVVDKFQHNEYRAVGGDDSSSKGNKFLNKVVFRDAVRLLVIADYNQLCK